jgi:hypothetical protein
MGHLVIIGALLSLDAVGLSKCGGATPRRSEAGMGVVLGGSEGREFERIEGSASGPDLISVA